MAADKEPITAAEKWGDAGATKVQQTDPAFPHAPDGWSRAGAQQMADESGLAMTDDHWELVDALQEFCQRHECSKYSTRELHDALDEKFHAKGGYKYLFGLFPGGPIAQGCLLAGLEPPAGAVDKGFGSVV
jgi:TusE/DsrC/DsvC family sulfur relay protein